VVYTGEIAGITLLKSALSRMYTGRRAMFAVYRKQSGPLFKERTGDISRIQRE
jgi:hypothetical protein